MKFGFISSFGTIDQHVALARETEEHGWDGFFTWDAISMDGEWAMPVYDPFSVLAAAAAVTERITLGAMVFAIPRHRPWELAQRALTVDRLSGGRLVLPVGVGVTDDRGFTSVPGQATGLKERAAQLDETLAWLEKSWSGEAFEFRGEHINTGPFRFPEQPVNGRIPVWPVGVWDAERPPAKNLRRTLRWDGIVPQLRGTADDLTTEDITGLVDWLTAHRSDQAGTDGTESSGADRPFEIILQGKLSTDPAEAAEQARIMADAGVTWWIESWWDPSKDSPESLLEKVRQGPPAI
ncbi:LLM class flavin-dependent oxidoreductase [Promicromonospora iranensis]|uniref:LLM class flavin-dependent oxidoreductase n=1 Tax=Promicromonospora iranensis TaxID=1105144 RepID=UPI0023A9EABD|nr:LLM class flavin-dependent oxidoreductase [Promicromonospora iranensis]